MHVYTTYRIEIFLSNTIVFNAFTYIIEVCVCVFYIINYLIRIGILNCN